MLITNGHPSPALHIALASWRLDTAPPSALLFGIRPPFAMLFSNHPLVAIAIAYSYRSILAHISHRCQLMGCILELHCLIEHFD
jgi:hypothetical protein